MSRLPFLARACANPHSLQHPANPLTHRPLTRRAALGALALLVWLSSPAVQADITLANRGRSDYRIVIAAQPLPSEHYAATELQSYLRRIAGVEIPIVNDAERPRGREILVGPSTRLEQLGIRLDETALGSDGFILRTAGRRLIIAGGRPRGTLNGVYTLLEERLGVRWFTPEVEAVPPQPRLRLPDLDETVVPALEYREVFWTEMMRDADFAARHRLNGDHFKLTERHGGPAVVYFPFVHSFDALVPPDLFAQHPEYFPLIDGERKAGYVQRCLSNPDVLQMSKNRVRQWIREQPQATIISVSQNDTFNYCQCPDCKALDDAEGSPAASLLRFVNAIAEDIAADHPHVRIDTLAYQYTRKPPRTLRPHRNVIVRLCSIECCFAHPLDTCPSRENRRFAEDIIAWQPVAPLLYIWDYTPNFAHYQQPFPNFDALQPNVRFFVNHGVKGLFEQGNYSPGGGGELGPLRAYVLAKLLWNPDTDVARHLDEFTRAYYGQAAPKIRAWLDAMHEPVRGKDCHAHIFNPPTACYLTDTVLEAGERLLDEAEKLAENDTIRFRVQVARLPVWYVQLATDRVKGDDRTALLKRFLEIARKAGISNISEGKALNDWARQLGAE
jgi:hypothetical protein